LGALGPLGPLGPLGIHNLERNDDGDYIDESGKIQRSIKVQWNASTKKEWPLFEDYTKERAIELGKAGKLDTSFMVVSVGSLQDDTYTVTVKEPQYVTIVVSPALYAKAFTLTVTEKSTNKIVVQSGKSISFNPWVQFMVAPEHLTGVSSLQFDVTISVNGLDCGPLTMLGQCYMEYYLYVVGSTKEMLRKPNIAYSGPYLKTAC